MSEITRKKRLSMAEKKEFDEQAREICENNPYLTWAIVSCYAEKAQANIMPKEVCRELYAIKYAGSPEWERLHNNGLLGLG
jgi:hypothetical protein